MIVDLDRQLVALSARRGPWNDCRQLAGLVDTANRMTRIGLVLADAEFDGERNHTYVGQPLGAQSVIPTWRGKKMWKLHGVRAQMCANDRAEFCHSTGG